MNDVYEGVGLDVFGYVRRTETWKRGCGVTHYFIYIFVVVVVVQDVFEYFQGGGYVCYFKDIL